MQRYKQIKKKGTETVYRGIKYRSKWEVYIAKLLLYSDVVFQYEPRRFFLTQSLSYLPDFYIPSRGIYLEVKGLLTNKDKLLLRIFSESNRLVFVGKDEISYFHGKSANSISKMDITRYVPTSGEVTRFRNFLEDAKLYQQHL